MKKGLALLHLYSCHAQPRNATREQIPKVDAAVAARILAPAMREMPLAIMNEAREAWLEIEHISGLDETLRRTRERVADVTRTRPLDRVEGFRQAVDATCDDFEHAIARIDRWWLPWDRACGKLVWAVAAGMQSIAKSKAREAIAIVAGVPRGKTHANQGCEPASLRTARPPEETDRR